MGRDLRGVVDVELARLNDHLQASLMAHMVKNLLTTQET